MKTASLPFCTLLFLLLLGAPANAQTADVVSQLSTADGHYYNKRYPEAMAIYLKHTKELSPKQQMALGVCYMASGVQNPPHYTEGMKWLLQSADRGHTDAMTTIASLYGAGFGVKKDSVQQIAWMRKAADFGDPSALTTVAYYYQLGWGLPKDRSKAKELYRKAIDRNSHQAGYYLAMMEQEEGNINNMVHYLENSARRGFTPACMALGNLYANGSGPVKPDLDEAYRWYNKVTYKAEYANFYNQARSSMRLMGLKEPPADLKVVQPLLVKLVSRANDGFSDLKGKLIEPANKGQFDNLGSSKNEYYAPLIDLGFKNAYIRRNNFNQVQKDQSVKNVDEFIYHAQLVHSANKEITYRVYKAWASIFKSTFPDWQVSEEDKPQYSNGSLRLWKQNSNGRRTSIELKTCCSNENVELKISNL